jgi:hypothetical protein
MPSNTDRQIKLQHFIDLVASDEVQDKGKDIIWEIEKIGNLATQRC